MGAGRTGQGAAGHAQGLPPPRLLRQEIPAAGRCRSQAAAARGLLDALHDGPAAGPRPRNQRHGLLLLRHAVGHEQRLPAAPAVRAGGRQGMDIPDEDRPAEERQDRLRAAHRRAGHTRPEGRRQQRGQLRHRCLPAGCLRIRTLRQPAGRPPVLDLAGLQDGSARAGKHGQGRVAEEHEDRILSVVRQP